MPIGMPDTASLPLFDEMPPLRWLSDETVYSIAARYSIASGLVSPSSISKMLFGHRRGGFPHALPSGISHFARVSNAVLGSAREIIVWHTVAPLLVAARSPALREATYQAMEQAHTGTLKAKLGLLASGFGGALPLKACRACVEEDEAGMGFSYWRVAHQLPGTWLCAKHALLLDVSIAMRSGQARYAWVLPKCEDLISPCETGATFDQSVKQRLARLADASHWLWTVGRHGVLDLARSTAILWDQLYLLNLARRPRRLRSDTVAQKFCEFFNTMRGIPELGRIAGTPSIAYSQLLSVLNGRATGLHPIRIASVVAWLSPDVQVFAQQYSRCRICGPPAPLLTDQLSQTAESEINPNRTTFLRLLESGLSISASARAVEVEVATGQAWAAAVGAHVPRRASLIVGDLRNRLVQSLREGVEKEDVANDFKISVSSVNRVLRTEAGLHETWRIARHEVRQHAMRKTWTRALTEAGGRPRLARALNPAAYAWLYRNDRTWLQCTNRAQERRRSNNSAVDWKYRDQQLSANIIRIASIIHAAGPKRVRLLDLLARLPLLKRNLRNLGRLPLTYRALAQATNPRPESHEMDLFQ